jgi:hypothetical protein
MTGLIGPTILLLVFSVIPYTVAVAMPNWRWLGMRRRYAAAIGLAGIAIVPAVFLAPAL